jgi:alpha-1,4-fucosyltransferase
MQRVQGEPLRVFLELEAIPHRSGSEDLFVSYHASSSVQVTYAGASFHVVRNYYVSPVKQTVSFLKQALLSLVFLYFQHLL